MLEPADYSDYIMLDVLDGCGELVVNSRSLGYVCTDPLQEYTPGVRLYFDTRKIIEHKLAVRDGLHTLKIKDQLPLEEYLVAAVTTADLDDSGSWTPTRFTKKANAYFYQTYVKR